MPYFRDNNMSTFEAIEFELMDGIGIGSHDADCCWLRELSDIAFSATTYEDVSWIEQGVLNVQSLPGYTTPETERSTSPARCLDDTVVTGQEQKQSIKGCHCKKSRCVRLYCECWGAGQLCHTACHCKQCDNKVRSADTNAHKTKPRDRCKCKRTRCVKKYCECFASGNKCGDRCKCLQCQNVAGGLVDKPSKKMKLEF